MMKKLAVILFVGTLVFGVAGVANALSITFTDTTEFNAGGTTPIEDYQEHGWGDVNKLDWTLDYVKWTHHFDFVPPATEVLNATLTLWLKDNEKDTLNPMTWDIGVGWAESGDWDIGGIDTGTYSYNVDGSYLEDGTFTITLASVWGNFYIDKSELEITYEPVPEPSTVFLLGSGLIGLLALGRKKFKK